MIGDRWGVSDSEVLRAYPCDEFVAAPVLQAWRGIRIEAPAAAVWPWAAPVLSAGDLIMARRQLLNLKELAERHHRPGKPPASR
jgi:hypothetical protein